jgi:hypothetical protein
MHSTANGHLYPPLCPMLNEETIFMTWWFSLNFIFYQINFVHRCVKKKNPLPLWIPCAFPHSVDIYAFVSTINENIFVLLCTSGAAS